MVATVMSQEEEFHRRVKRGHGGSGLSIGSGNTVVDGLSVWAVSGGANSFVQSYQAGQNFQASSGRKNYLGQQGGLIGTSTQYLPLPKHLPSNVAGYGGFPSYGR